MNALTNSICTFSELHKAEPAVTMVAMGVVIRVLDTIKGDKTKQCAQVLEVSERNEAEFWACGKFWRNEL